MADRTALYAAAFDGRPRMFRLLLELGANPCHRDKSGLSVLGAFGRFPELFDADSAAILHLVRCGLSLSLLWEFVRDVTVLSEETRFFVFTLILRIRSARAAMKTVLLAHSSAPLSPFAQLPAEMVAYLISFLWSSQTDEVWVLPGFWVAPGLTQYSME
jgi:hypothetical protein